ncbi:MAG TPA: PKD domain-containing protein [Candidatus Dormibacteraeota bacterium]
MKVPSVHMIMNGRRQAAQSRFLKRGVILRCLTLGLAAVLGLVVALPASAATTVSQPTWSKWYPISFGERAQTFTATTTGTLDHVSLLLNYDYGYGSGGTVDVRNVDATTLQPTGAALPGSVLDLHDSTATYVYPFYVFPLPSPISVTSGTKYAIVVTITYGVRSWAGLGSPPPVDIGGRAWTAPGCIWTCAWTSAGFFPMDFAFEAGMTAAPPKPANSAPTVKANLDAVQVNEGAVPTAAGTYSDPDGDTVTLSASDGTVTPGAGGTWSWKGAAADEGQGQTITITADDGHGNSATAQFTTVVVSVLPTAKISGAPGSVREGQTIALTASATSPSAEDTAAGFAFNWTATEYGNALPGSSGSSFSLKTDDEGVYVITLTATDESGHVSPTVSVTINGVDSTPAASITSVTQAFVIVPQQTLSFSGTYTDAGSVVDTSYTTTWSWGDGSPNSAGNSATHAFASSGTYTVTYRAADDDGVAGSASTTVTVLTPAAALAKIAGLVSGQSGLNKGQMNSLLAKLNAAGDSWQRGDSGAACNQLNAFVNEVDADQKTGRISSGDAATMTDAARLTQRSMGCFRTLVEFLSGL